MVPPVGCSHFVPLPPPPSQNFLPGLFFPSEPPLGWKVLLCLLWFFHGPQPRGKGPGLHTRDSFSLRHYSTTSPSPLLLGCFFQAILKLLAKMFTPSYYCYPRDYPSVVWFFFFFLILSSPPLYNVSSLPPRSKFLVMSAELSDLDGTAFPPCH